VTDVGLEIGAKMLYEVGDLLGASMRRVGKFINSHPRGAGRDPGISRI
jgi:hypothetical protein